MKKLLALAFVFSALSVQAGIGETKQQVEARYGKPVTPGTKPTNGIGDLELAYDWKEFFVIVTYLDGRSLSEIISRQDDKRILIPEIESLLKLQGNGFKRGKDKLSDDGKNEIKVWETPNNDRAMYLRDKVASKKSEYMLFVESGKCRDLKVAPKKGSKTK